MAAPKGNRNAVKPDKERLDDDIRIRCRPDEKQAWEGAARKQQKKFRSTADWARAALNRAALRAK